MSRPCTCAGTAPGWPQHEWFCGLDDTEDTTEPEEHDG